MTYQSYQATVASIRHVCLTLSLQLPTHTRAIATQLRHLHQARHQLERLEMKVRVLANRSWSPMQRTNYQVLNQLLHHLLIETANLTLLAEEFTADPEGTVSCLREVNRRKNDLIQQLHAIERGHKPVSFESSLLPSTH